MSIGGGKPYVFKPARRVFAGRGRSMMTFGEWKIAFASMAFGAFVGAAAVYPPEESAKIFALVEPPLTRTAPLLVADAREAAGAVFAAAKAPFETPAREPAPRLVARASRIVDGDTLYLEGVATRIRLWGLDAPEREDAGYDAATQALSGLVSGRMLACEQIDTDRYGRIVARCYTEDGRDVSGAMIKSGAAREYLRYSHGYYGGS
jgi:endonuclease YncB( thermonuclease family)